MVQNNNQLQLKPEQLKTLAGASKMHKDLTLDIEGKTFIFTPQFLPKEDIHNKTSN